MPMSYHTPSPQNPSIDRRWACPGLFRMPQAADGGICRIKLEFGHITPKQLRVLSELIAEFGNGELEATTRGNVQIRSVKAERAKELSQRLLDSGFGPRTKGGDDIRNVMINPTAGFDHNCEFTILPFAEELSQYLQKTPAYQKLSPKFSFLVDGGEESAILNHSSDIWLSLCDEGKFFAFGVASTPPTQIGDVPAMGKVPASQGLDLVCSLLNCLISHQQDKTNIHRMKNLVAAIGRDGIYKHITQLPDLTVLRADTFQRVKTAENADLSIHKTRFSGRYYLGIKAPLARISAHMLNIIADCAESLASRDPLRVTPWQSIIFTNCTHEEAIRLKSRLESEGFVTAPHQPFARITCCAGAPGCAAAKANVLHDARLLAKYLENHKFPPVHLTGCAKSCAAMRTNPATLVATAPGIYDLYFKDDTAPSKFGRLAASNLPIKMASVILSQPRAVAQ